MRLIQSALAVALPLSLFACSSDTRTDTAAGSGTGTGSGSGSGTGGAGGGAGGGSAADPCSIEALEEPKAATTYFVAVNEPGASNEACDGLAPSDEGNGRCPFKDLSSPAVRSLLDGAKSTRLELRAGTYVVTGWDGLRVSGTGASEAERVVLTSHRGEEAVLDVATPDGAGCTDETAPTKPACVRQVVRVSGQYTVVQGLTIRNGLGYNVEVTGGAHHLVRCNHLTETADFPLRSDSLKLDGKAVDIAILRNEFSQWRSQAIDMTEVSDVLVEGNDFHDPHDEDGGATGCKLGTKDVMIRGNTVHDLGSSTQTSAFGLGGTGTPHADEFEAYRIQVVGNPVWNVPGKLAQVVSCQGCSVEKNDVFNIGGGVLVAAQATGLPECSASASGCRATEGMRVAGNRMKGFHGAGDPASANIFVYVDAGEGEGFVGADNIYCAPAEGAHRFGWLGDLLAFDAWVGATKTDASSKALVESDPLCEGF
jgi:hypothetical protein